MTDEPEIELGAGARPGDGANFAPQRLGEGRRTPPVLAWVVAIVGVVAIGFAGRLGSDGGGQANSGATSRTPVPAIAVEASPGTPVTAPATDRRWQPTDRNPIAGDPIARNPRTSSTEGPIHLELVRTSASIFVHADVHASHVAWVSVQVQTDAGGVAGWASLSFPGLVDPPADAADSDKPALRFDVELVIPDDMRAGQLWTQVNVYDNLGRRVATTRLAVPPPGATDALEREFIRGFRPMGPPWNREAAGEG